MRALGLKEDQFELGTFETRRFPDARQEILEKNDCLAQEISTKIVFVHTAQDLHQDHQIVTQEAMRAFRGTTVLGFDVLRSSYGFFPHFLTEVSEEDLNTK